MPAIATPRQAPAIASSERNSGRRVSDGRDRCSLFIMHSSSRKQAISFRPMQILSRAASCRSRGSAGLQHRGAEGTLLRGGSPPAGARRLTASAAALSPTVFSPRR